MKIRIYKHGDVTLKETDATKGEEIKTDLLFKGEQHHHRVRGDFKILKDGDQIYLQSNGCTLFHEEHDDIIVKPGSYKMHIAREYDHILEESRRVID